MGIKKKTRSRSKFLKNSAQNPTRTQPGYSEITKKNPYIYIYICSYKLTLIPSFFNSRLLTSLSLPHSHSYIAYGLTHSQSHTSHSHAGPSSLRCQPKQAFTTNPRSFLNQLHQDSQSHKSGSNTHISSSPSLSFTHRPTLTLMEEHKSRGGCYFCHRGARDC